MPAILDGERELVTPLAVEQHTLYGIERALFGIRWADEIGEGEREAIKSAQIRYSTTPIGRDWGSRSHMDENVPQREGKELVNRWRGGLPLPLSRRISQNGNGHRSIEERWIGVAILHVVYGGGEKSGQKVPQTGSAGCRLTIRLHRANVNRC